MNRNLNLNVFCDFSSRVGNQKQKQNKKNKKLKETNKNQISTH